jgi:4a-hydroxytetrahydrobiopterin dehydratase
MLNTDEFLKSKSHPVDRALTDKEIEGYLKLFEGWSLENGKITKDFHFDNYYETMAFVNAVAFIADKEDHHPELEVSYNKCIVKYDTHSVNQGRGGLSENDFICAAKIDALIS